MDESPIAECRLDLDGLRLQRDRYRTLGTAVERIVRAPQLLTVGFTATVDLRLLDETLAVERSCCPFFMLDYDPAPRRLTATVGDPGQGPALDALVTALDAADAADAARRDDAPG